MKTRASFPIIVILCLNLLLTGAAAAATAGPPNPMGRLSDPTPTSDPASPNTPINVETLHFAAVASGYNHICALTDGGGVKCWGSNLSSNWGDGTPTQYSTPVDVSGLTSGVTTLAVGGSHACALTASGGVKCWGQNYRGQLGDGTTTQRNAPVDVSGLGSGVMALAAGAYHTCAVTAAGGVKCWGDNASGQLGDGTMAQRNTPVNVSGLASGVSALAAGGSAAGGSHTCALTTGGGVKCWGNNWSGQLGDGTTTNRSAPVNVSGLTSGIISLAAGEAHTCAVTAGGGVKCWGYNYLGQLGDGTTTGRSTPVDVNGLSGGITKLAAGSGHTCALTSAGGVKCWGYNESGQLGDGTTFWPRTTPVDVSGLTTGATALAAGESHTCALTADGGVKCWGANSSGQLGDGTTLWRGTPVDVSGLGSGVTALTAGERHTCAVTAGGKVKCWGDNSSGQLGDGTEDQRSTPVDVGGLGSGVTALAAGMFHTCALTVPGGVKCWGLNRSGQLGNGSTFHSQTPVDVNGLTSGVIVLAAGWEHTCAVTTGGGVKCWGQNYGGQLGDGTTTRRTRPVDVSGLGSGVTALTAGERHTCAVTAGGEVKCWGANSFGQLGDGTTTQRSTPVDVNGLGSGVVALAAGYGHTCAQMDAAHGGGVKCWGNNYFGQLGDGTTTNRSAPVDVSGLSSGITALTSGWYHLCAVTANGGAKCWGSNSYGQLGDGTITNRSTPVAVSGLGSGVAKLAAGSYHACAVVSGGRPKCWGSDSDGQLGIGTIVERLTPVDVVENVLPSLTINYPDGQPGSYFTFTGWNFPVDAQATLSINGLVITRLLRTNATGSFIFFLNTAAAETGSYDVTVSVNPSATTSFTLADGAPLRPQEGGGRTVTLFQTDHFTYLPLVLR